MSEEYLSHNEKHWQQGCEAENVESHVFRPYGVILRDELGLTGRDGEKVLDFGCGEGTNSYFFKQKGFNVFGVDISKPDLSRCMQKMPDIKNQFIECNRKPSINDMFFDGDFDLVIAIHSMYYYTNEDLEIRLNSLYNMMKPGGIIYVTMIGTQSEQFSYADDENDGLYRVSLPHMGRDRVKESYSPHYKNFTSNMDELIDKFSMFNPLHIGHFEERYSQTGATKVSHVFHYTFIGQK